MTTDEARELCRSLLAAELPRRWAHCQGVARRAAGIRHVVGDQGNVIEAAAWLHDVGYAPSLVVAGFHPLDGARYLRDSGLGDRTVRTLVAHHTGALIEAGERGLADALAAEFPIGEVDPFLMSALTYCDMTTGPDGSHVDVEQRLSEILVRYPEDHVVHRSIARAAPSLRAQVGEVSALVGTV